jgi:hypothetical protein
VSGESAFGELLNGFTLDNGKRRRRAVGHPATPAKNTRELAAAWAQLHDPEDESDDAPAVVRAYAWTRGRTTSRFRFEIETLLSTTGQYHEHDDATPSEYHAVAALCQQPRSVAEVAALLTLPLGVVKVIAGDMAMEGLLSVHDTASVDGESPDLMLMERILSGLRRL